MRRYVFRLDMNVGIEDCELTYKASLLIFEELLRLSVDNFSVQFNSSIDRGCERQQKRFKESISEFYLGVFTKEVCFFSYNTNCFRETSKHYKFNRDSIHIISRSMGRGLMCFKSDLEWGISEWQFYSGNKLIAGANVKDDYFYIYGVSQRFIDRLSTLKVPVIYQT